MPDWTPNWDDVVFDHGAAADAAAACRGAAADADGGLGRRRGPVVEDWAGRYRDDFDGEERAVRSELDRARVELVRLAVAIEAASEAAVVEQRRRVVAGGGAGGARPGGVDARRGDPPAMRSVQAVLVRRPRR